MGEKKSKALAQELMDDLLDSESGEFDIGGPGETELIIENVAVQEGSEPDVDFSELTAEPESDAPAPEEHTMRLDATVPSVDSDSGIPSNPSVRSRSKSSLRAVPDLDEPAPPSPPPSAPKQSAAVGRFGAMRTSSSSSVTEAALAQSESLRVAQARLLELEQEIERLRLQNEELAASAETLRRRTDELSAANQKRESDYQHAVSAFDQEKDVLLGSKEALQREVEQLKQRNEELELRISTNIQKIRVRERELENRLELVKMEGAALIRSKDEMILELKRQIDQLNMELGNYRTKNQELNRLTTDKQEMLRRTVKALRLALSMLEGEEEAPPAASRKAK